MPNIIIRQSYYHYNSALGCEVKGKDHYDRLMKERGYVSQEENDQRVNNSKDKALELSKNGWDIIKAAKNRADSKGRVKLDGRLGEEMVRIKAIGKEIPSYMQLPTSYDKGGFTK